MESTNKGRVRARGAQKRRPDVRAIARMLIELSMQQVEGTEPRTRPKKGKSP